MSLPIAITDPLRRHTVELERLEFKKGWHPVDVLHTLCAFAKDHHNLGGGCIVLAAEEGEGHHVLPPVGITSGDAERIDEGLQNLGHSANAEERQVEA